MIRTGLLDVTFLENKEVFEEHYRKIPDFRKNKVNKIRTVNGKTLSMGVWILFQQMKEEYGIDEQATYNFSHSGRYALCSLADRENVDVEVGCDVERIAKLRLEVAKRFFCEAENKFVQTKKTEEEQVEAFYRMWVLKESFIKATREGMGMDLRSFEVGFFENGTPYLKHRPENFRKNYWYKEYKVEAGDAKVAVCATTPEFDERLHVYGR